MRRKSLLNFIIGLLVLGGIGISQAQTTVTLLDWNQQWRYLITNALPSGFSASNYPAANGWLQGAGPLSYSGTAHEPMPAGVPASMTLLATNFNNMFVTSFYFRTSINVTSVPSHLIITGTVVADDGAVIYVNGREVQRLGVNAGTVTHNTFANRGGEVTDANRIESFSIASSNFVQGVNVIAASVHQQSQTSSDVAFGMRITAQLLEPIVITQQPQDTTADAGNAATFTVGVTGTNPRYQWFTNNVAVLNATNSTLIIPNTTAAMSGRIIHVVVTNLLGSVRSSNAVLTVVTDRNGPVIVSAVTTASNAFEIRFNETITQLSSTNVANYVVHVLGTTQTLTVTQAQYGINLTRIRVNGNFSEASNYVVCAYNISDQSGNVTAVDCFGITGPAITNAIFGLMEQWHFTDRITDNTLANTNWTAFSFDDSEDAGWGIASGLFYNYIDPPNTCSMPLTTVLKGARTHYYRKKFTVTPIPATNVTLIIRHAVDDGAVFYINETEVGRYNMPPGPVDYATVASGSVGTVACNILTVNVATNLFRVGANNIIAVEVHQQEGDPGGAASDAAFDMQLDYSYRRTPLIPTLTARRVLNSIFVEWVGTGWQLQHAVQPTGGWTNLTSGIINVQGTNRYQTPISAQNPRRFYRLRNP